MLNIVLFGPPGAGKGTQSDKLISKYNLVHFSTGDILRCEIAAKSKLGIEAKNYMDKGELVPDAVVIGMISSKIKENENSKGFIFDGFPRTKEQAYTLDNLLSEYNTSIKAMLALEVEHNELVKRLLKRGLNSGRPDDRNKEVIEKRITIYHKRTSVLKDFYSLQNKYYAVNGMGAIDETFHRLCKHMNSLV